MASGKKVVMQGDDMDAYSMGQEFDRESFTLDDLEREVQPLLSSTPARNTVKATCRKRQRDQRSVNVEQSCT